MTSFRCAIILVVVVLCLFQNCISFFCYECENDKCTANITTMSRTPCLDNKQCFKLVNPETDVVTKRGCEEKGFCDIYPECNMCADELCNTSSQIVPFLGIMSFLGIILAKLYIV